jgi:hypothetical protein
MVQHIIALLKFHDYVIIPGLGGFISHYEGAKRSLSTQTITPPTKRLAFNKSLQENDGLLINQLVSAEGITQTEAKSRIEAFKIGVEESLEHSGAYLFPGIGKLLYDNNRILQFHPILQENLLLDSFGLERVVAQPIHRIKEAFELKQIQQDAAQTAQSAIQIGNVVPLPQEEIYQPVLFRAAAAIGLMFVVSTVFMSLFNSNVSTAQLSFLPMPQPIETFEAHLASNKTIEAPEMDAQNFTLYQPIVIDPVIEETVEVVVPQTVASTSQAPAKSKGTYKIIVGSFLDDARMNREIAMLQSKGFVVRTISGPNGYTRVAIQFTEAPVSAKLSKLQEVRNTINPDAWILGL